MDHEIKLLMLCSKPSSHKNYNFNPLLHKKIKLGFPLPFLVIKSTTLYTVA